jgi:hypothetical protein
VNITGNTNFYLFWFDLKNPVIIAPQFATVTYFNSGQASDFTQTLFVCHTDQIPDMGCGSSDPTTGFTINFTPEPSTLVLALSASFLVARRLYRGSRRRTADGLVDPR